MSKNLDPVERETSSLRKLVSALTLKRGAGIPEGSVILEVGCGNVGELKDCVGEKGVWYGLDVKGALATHNGSVRKIPFPDNFFDVVVCSQSIEHWYEYLTGFDEGLSEIHRVLKMGGMLYLDFPMYLHGHPLFMLGKKEGIQRLYKTRSWNIREIHEYMPEEPYYTWRGKRKKYALEWICQECIRRKEYSAYIMSVTLRKNSQQYFHVSSFIVSVSQRLWMFLVCLIAGAFTLNERLWRVLNRRRVP